VIDMAKRVLVVGSWAKGQITIENIRKKNLDVNIFAYMSTKNPGIVPVVNGYKIGSFKAINDIVAYAKKQDIDLVIVTTAEPLSFGVVDALEKEKIRVFGPTKQAAQLESDKGFMRELMKKYEIDALPQFQVFDNADAAVRYARDLDWNVAVKPVGLTEGLGVKIFGSQLKNREDVADYIHQVFSERGDSKVLLEENLVGEEFTIQCFVNGNYIIPTPAVQDFKKLLPGDKGPNTASMGSYSDNGHLLPFMEQEDYVVALDIIMETLDAFHSETGEVCRGFLYGQFMLTEDGIKLIEYNFRPGDPEWINTVSVLKSNILEIIERLMDEEVVPLRFEDKATVCKYLVPKNYPKKLHQILDVSYEEVGIKKEGVNFYYSCGIDSEGRLNTGSERGIAFIAKDTTIFDANKKVEQAISLVKGDFYHRKDIGTNQLIDKKIDAVNTLRDTEVVVRKAKEDEFLDVYGFVFHCDPLEYYFEHFYKIMLRYFNNCCFVAEYDKRIVGFVLGFIPMVPNNTYFLWQIGVDPLLQGEGIGTMLLEKVEREVKKLGCNRIELTIDPENVLSQRMFEKTGYRNISGREGETVELNGNTAVKDYYGPERHFMLYEKKLWIERKHEETYRRKNTLEMV